MLWTLTISMVGLNTCGMGGTIVVSVGGVIGAVVAKIKIGAYATIVDGG